MNRIQVAAQLLAGAWAFTGLPAPEDRELSCKVALQWADELLKQAGHGGTPVRTFPVAPPPVRR